MAKSGWVILDKGSGMGSRWAGNQVRKIFGAETFGHIGTLDPMASGVLPIALGEATKMIPYLPAGRKVYEFGVVFGVKTDTDDVMGRVMMRSPVGHPRFGKPLRGLCHPSREWPGMTDIEKVLPGFIGKIMQVPPAYSAVHINGVRAYKLARAGKSVEIPAREVEIYKLEVVSPAATNPEQIGIPACAGMTMMVECSQGTYVRSLARDIAAALGTICAVDMIRRVDSGGFSIKNAIRLEKLKELVDNGGNESDGIGSASPHRKIASRFFDSPARGELWEGGILMPIDYGLDGIPVLNLDSVQARLFRNGGFVDINAGNYERPCIFRIYNDDEFVGIGEVREGMLRPKRVINNG
ncbi:MAG: tRNA pseudouridine(55) synthase TruB [Rickettsiales bacterium]|jgi:tRNA U55 pseudouridine synthase TruB|nr:tRNA pseudouridine(55) synthase TruB [Rickettsiales bacterium]